MQRLKSGCGLGVLAFLGLAFVFIGVFAGVIQASRVSGEAAEAQQLPELDAPAFAQSAPGTRVAVTGVLADPFEQTGADGLLIYLEEQWALDYDEEQGWEGAWETVYVAAPECVLLAPGGEIALAYAREVAINGALRETTVYVPEQGREVDGLVEGTVRHRGFAVGDQITVVGNKAEAALLPTRIVGGDRAALVATLTQQVIGLRIAGGIFGLVGLLLVAFAGILFVRGAA